MKEAPSYHIDYTHKSSLLYEVRQGFDFEHVPI